MKISIIIPCYNEERRISHTLKSIEEFCRLNPDVISEILIVSDGCKDRTTQIASQWKKRCPIIIHQLEKNQGKGAALREGILKAQSDYVLTYDADAATPIEELLRLYADLRENNADIAIGIRVGDKISVQMDKHRRFIGRIYFFLSSPLIPNIRDAACGCKLYKSDVAKHLFSIARFNRFAHDIEILSLAIENSYSIVQTPVRWISVPASKVHIVLDGMEMSLRVLQLYFFRFFPKKVNKRQEEPVTGDVTQPIGS